MRKIITVSLIALHIAPAPSFASDADAISSAKSLAILWSDIPARNFVSLECDHNTIKLLRLRTSKISYDVVKSDSIISPYKIIIDLDISSQTNEPVKIDYMSPNFVEKMRNMTCYKSYKDALAHTSDKDFADSIVGSSQIYRSRLVYGFNDEGYRLLSAAPSMTSVLVPGALQSQRNGSVWGALVAGR